MHFQHEWQRQQPLIHIQQPVTHQQEAVTAHKVNITLIPKPLVIIGGLQWSGLLIFFHQKNRIFIVYVQPAKASALLDLAHVLMGTKRLEWE